MTVMKKIGLGLLALSVAIASLAVTGSLLLAVLQISGVAEGKSGTAAVDVAIMDRYDMYMTNQISDALNGVLAIEKYYWLSDDDIVAPEPNQACYGTTDDPSTMGWFLEKANELLGVEDTLFTTDTVIAKGSEVMYYLDETIMAITWKFPDNDCMYTVSEVKLAHPSQFRRFLSGGAYGSEKQLLTTEMAASVNAVVASSGDFYAHRRMGVIVYDGVVQRTHSKLIDTCYIDEEGNMRFSYRGELLNNTEAQNFVDEHGIRFSVAFGPVLVDKGVARPAKDYENYEMGAVKNQHSRIALCQRGPLHYFVAIAGQDYELNCYRLITLAEFQKQIVAMGCEMAYTMDGGQTATLVMNDQLINMPSYNSERNISDIIYFATAIPNGE